MFHILFFGFFSRFIFCANPMYHAEEILDIIFFCIFKTQFWRHKRQELKGLKYDFWKGYMSNLSVKKVFHDLHRFYTNFHFRNFLHGQFWVDFWSMVQYTTNLEGKISLKIAFKNGQNKKTNPAAKHKLSKVKSWFSNHWNQTKWSTLSFGTF